MKTIHVLAPVRHEAQILNAYRKQYSKVNIHRCNKEPDGWCCQQKSCHWHWPISTLTKTPAKSAVSA
jgi:hypothetical protein